MQQATNGGAGSRRRLGEALTLAGGALAAVSAPLTWWVVGEEELFGIPFPEMRVAGLHSWHGKLALACGVALLLIGGLVVLRRDAGAPLLGAAALAAGGATLTAALLGLWMANTSPQPWLLVAATGGALGAGGGWGIILEGTRAAPIEAGPESWRT